MNLLSQPNQLLPFSCYEAIGRQFVMLVIWRFVDMSNLTVPAFTIDHEVSLSYLPAQIAESYFEEGNSFCVGAEMLRSASTDTPFQAKFVFPEFKNGVLVVQFCVESYVGAATKKVGDNVYRLAVPFSSGGSGDKRVSIQTTALPLEFFRLMMSDGAFEALSNWAEAYAGSSNSFNVALEGEDALFFTLKFRAGKETQFSKDPLQVENLEVAGELVEGKNYGTKVGGITHPALARRREAAPAASTVPAAAEDDVM
jgi:hypothetical protein